MSQDNESADEQNDAENNSENFETVLYAFPREATTAEDLTAISEALPGEYRVSVSEGDGENLLIQRERESGSSLDVSEVLNE